jgi:putative tricarboxylic transport membrane protein
MAAPEHDEAAESPAVASNRGVDIAVSVALLAVAGVLAFDNWRTGMGWDATGPQAGYFPFYLALILAGSSIYGIFKELAARHTTGEAFVRRVQLRRVMQVLVPTIAFVLLLQWLGLYVASFLLIAGFMVWVGRIAAWKSVLTALIFSVVMFATFEIAFDVIMPKGPLEALLGF